MKRYTALIALIAATTLAGAAFASPMDGVPVYGAISANSSSLNLDTTGLDSFDKKATGFGIAVGAQVHPNVAIEVDYTNYGSRTATFTAPGGMVVRDPVDLSAFGLHAVLSAKVTDAFSVFAKPGIIDATARASGYPRQDTSKTQFNIGIGAEYAVTSNVGVYAAIDRTSNFGGSDARLTTTAIGIRVHH